MLKKKTVKKRVPIGTLFQINSLFYGVEKHRGKEFVKSRSTALNSDEKNVLLYEKPEAIIRHKVQNKESWLIELESGDTLFTTGDHSAVIIDESGSNIIIKPKDVEPGLLMQTSSGSFRKVVSCRQQGYFDDVYVYDISMNINHTFFANSIKTKNTDSNYFVFGDVFESMGIDPTKIRARLASDIIEYMFIEHLNPMYDKILKDSFEGRHGEHTMKFEHEVTGKKGIWNSKKKYVLSLIWKDGKYIADLGWLKAVGIELVQRSNSQYVKDTISKYISLLMSNEVVDTRLIYSMSAKLKDSLKDISIVDISGKVNLGKYNEQVSNDRDKIEYTGQGQKGFRRPGPAPRGAARYNHLVFKNKLGYKYPYIKRGDKVHFYFDKYGEPFSFPDGEKFPKEIAPELCVDTQLEKLIFTPVKRLMNGAIDIDVDQLGERVIQRGFNIKKMKK